VFNRQIEHIEHIERLNALNIEHGHTPGNGFESALEI
jgi:hypothetical protein